MGGAGNPGDPSPSRAAVGKELLPVMYDSRWEFDPHEGDSVLEAVCALGGMSGHARLRRPGVRGTGENNDRTKPTL